MRLGLTTPLPRWLQLVTGCSGLGGARSALELIHWPMAREVVMQALIKRLWSDDSGQDTTEYVLLVALIALAVTAGMILLATNINEAFSAAGSEVNTLTP